MSNTNFKDSDEIDIINIVRPISQYWKLVLAIFIFCATCSFVISKLLPKTYQSSALIYVQQNTGSFGMLKSLPINLGGLSSGGSSAYYENLLKSRTLLKRVVIRLDLNKNKIFAGKKGLSIRKAVERLTGNTDVKVDLKGSITVTVKAGSPKLAANIVNEMLDILSETVVKTKNKKADFIEDRLQETTKELKESEDRLVKFSQQNDIASIDEEVKGLVQKYGELEGKLIELDVELQKLDSNLANSGQINMLVDQEVAKKALLSSKEYLIVQKNIIQDKLKQLPSVAAKYARLQRDVMISGKTFELLTEQYQMAKITQSGEDADYQIIDKAEVDPKKVSPRGSVNTAIGGMLGFFFAAVLVNILNYRKNDGR